MVAMSNEESDRFATSSSPCACCGEDQASEPRAQAGLSVERIVRAAIEVADAEGLAALSMRRVADRLGVGTMSLYHYVLARTSCWT